MVSPSLEQDWTGHRVPRSSWQGGGRSQVELIPEVFPNLIVSVIPQPWRAKAERRAERSAEGPDAGPCRCQPQAVPVPARRGQRLPALRPLLPAPSAPCPGTAGRNGSQEQGGPILIPETRVPGAAIVPATWEALLPRGVGCSSQCHFRPGFQSWVVGLHELNFQGRLYN